jgi:hypothetical protein
MNLCKQMPAELVRERLQVLTQWVWNSHLQYNFKFCSVPSTSPTKRELSKRAGVLAGHLRGYDVVCVLRRKCGMKNVSENFDL